MIFDTLKNCELYFGLNDKFQQAFDFIKLAVAENKPIGKYEIDGDSLYASVQEYDSKLDAKFEGHKRYIDIQYVVSGEEVMKAADISKMTANTEYNDVKDCTYYEDNDLAFAIPVQQGEYAVFYPHDIHKPGLAKNGIPTVVRKIVVKVKI